LNFFQKANILLSGRDLIGVQNLIKKHQALQAELAGHEPRINNVCVQGDGMIKENHFASSDINAKIEELQARWQALKVCFTMQLKRT
jgi:spectrin alpha